MTAKYDACIADWFSEFKEVTPTASSSESVLVFGTLEPSVFPETTTRDVVMKLSLAPEDDDNSLEMEGKIYNFVREHVIARTPHALPGLSAGVCDDAELKEFRYDADAAKKSLYAQWFALRLKREWKTLPRVERKKYEAQVRAQGHTMEARDVVLHSSIEFEPGPMYYVITPRIGDVTLHDFLSDEDWEKTRADLTKKDILSVVVQAAQLLSVLAEEKMTHHDLHGGNWFLKKHATDQIVAYTTPVKAVMRSRLGVVAFDFDHASVERLGPNKILETHFCTALGECSEYQENFDWYTFLVYYRSYLQRAGLAVPTLINTLLRGSDQSIDAYVGRPCECVERNADKTCAKCELKKDFLRAMPSPARIFTELAASPKLKASGLFF